MNELFLQRMKELLKEDYPAYLETLDQPAFRGFRVNPLKTTPDELFKYFDVKTKPSPFIHNGFILLEDDRLGRTLAHKQGLIYMQEPSASTVVQLLDPRPGEMILDLCAAPGSKSTQIAEYMQQEGTLISNEIDHKRSQVLLSNIERLGISNAIVTNASPEKLCPVLKNAMDKILVDAPCSGEGMFKKEDEAINGWSVEHVLACAQRQRKILDSAYEALKEGGILVYSTCTYAIEENEDTVSYFLDQHPDMELLPIDVAWGRAGVPSKYHTEYCRRIFPMDGGEGQFMAKFRKNAGSTSSLKSLKSKVDKSALAFMEQMMEKPFSYVYQFNDKVYGGNHPFFELKGINVVRQQVLLGEMVKNRFEPHHHFFTCLEKNNTLQLVEVNESEANTFVKGETLPCDKKGYQAVFYEGQPLGYGKADGSQLKNKYPKGLRNH